MEVPEEARHPWFCVLDEFQRFVANEGSAQVLAQMLSEVRKMGLRLCLAHQGWHQLGNARLEGALDQAQIKVVFGSGSKTARIVAEEPFVADPQKVKHEVDDPDAQERTHPYYESLMEQKELFVPAIRRQGQREITLLSPESDRVVSLRTRTVPSPAIRPEQLEAVKARLLEKEGRRLEDRSTPNSNSTDVYRREEVSQKQIAPTYAEHAKL